MGLVKQILSATVETKIGTITTDVSHSLAASQETKTSVANLTMLVYITILLSSLAFIAALAAVATLRSKLA